MVTDINYTYCEEHFVRYVIVKSPEANTVLFTLAILQKKKRETTTGAELLLIEGLTVKCSLW